MSFADDNSGIAYAIVYIMMGIICVGGCWIIMGVSVDEFNLLAVDLAGSGMWGVNTTDGCEDLTSIWNLVLWLTVGCSFVYGIVTAIRKERSGSFEN